MQIFNRPKIIDEAASSSYMARHGKKPGLFWLLDLLLVFGVIFTVQICGAIAYIILRLPYDMRMKMIPSPTSILGLPLEDYVRFADLLVTAVTTILVLIFIRFVQMRKLRTAGFVKKNAVKHYLIGLVIGAGMFAAAVGICALFGSIKISYAGGFDPVVILVLFLGWMIQGNSEEVLCRGYIMVSLSRRYHVAVGVFINSLLFGALHLANPGVSALPIINICLFGIVMSLMFLRTGNIWMVSALHTAWNFVQGNVFGVLVSGGDVSEKILSTELIESKALINGGVFGLEGGLAVTIVLAVTIGVLIFVKPCKDI